MILSELGFRDYYHQYIILEADALTDQLKDCLDVEEDDCYMLVSSFIASSGALKFNVLSIGSSLDSCRKGLCLKDMLHVFPPEEVGDLRCKTMRPDSFMIRKNVRWIERRESLASDALRLTRRETRIDHLRNDFFPDVVRAGIVGRRGIREYDMRIENFEGPFLVGRLLEKPLGRGYHVGELLRTMPYQLGSSMRLLTVFAGDTLSDEDEKNKHKLIQEAQEIGYGFCGPGFRN